MALSNDLITQFAKLANSSTVEKTESTVTGTITKFEDGTIGVKLDGSETVTPITSTVSANEGDRVTVLIKDHTATVTGNITDPSASSGTVSEVSNTVTKLGSVVAEKVTVEELAATNAKIDTLNTEVIKVNDTLTANAVKIETLDAEKATVEDLTATNASIDALKADVIAADNAIIDDLETNYLKAYDIETTYLKSDVAETTYLKTTSAEAKYATIEELNSTNATITNLDTVYATIDFANINEVAIRQFFTKSGMIENVIIGNSTITGALVGVTIKGDLIEAGTVKADKLVILGTDGLYYKLNVNSLGETTASSDEKYQNGLDGSNIIANSITAEKISVKDLVAFGANIGGFKIDDNAIRSFAKDSPLNTARGVYFDNDGQFAIGDSINYFRYFKDTNGKYQLQISADSIHLNAGSKSLGLEIGGENLWVGSDFNEESLRYERGENDNTELGYRLYVDPHNDPYQLGHYISEPIVKGHRYTLSVNIRGSANIRILIVSLADSSLNYGINWLSKSDMSATEYKKYSITFESTIDVVDGIYIATAYGANNTLVGDWFEMEPNSGKLEKGDFATDWSLAKEDVDANVTEKISDLNADISARMDISEGNINMLANSLQSMVVDKNGSTLMQQTGDGWVFSMGTTVADLMAAQSAINALNESSDLTDIEIENIKNELQHLLELNSYVRIDTSGEKPVIELGNDSSFKVRITNSSIDFMNGDIKMAYVTNDSLKIRKAEVEDELIMGGFAWKERPNGNMGLIWKG